MLVITEMSWLEGWQAGRQIGIEAGRWADMQTMPTGRQVGRQTAELTEYQIPYRQAHIHTDWQLGRQASRQLAGRQKGR